MKRMMTLLLGALLVAGFGCDKKSNGESKESAKEEKSESTKESDQAEKTGKEEGEKDENEKKKAEESGGSEGAKDIDPALLKPGEASQQAPKTFKVKFETTKGDFVGEFHREWAPNGADRLYNLVRIGF